MSSLKRMLPFVQPYRWVVFWLVITVVLPVAMELLVPKALNYIIDTGIEAGDMAAIWRGAAIMLGTALTGAAATLGQGVCRALLAQGLTYDMRNKLLGLAYYSTGDLGDSLKNLELASSALDKDPGERRTFDQTDVEREIGWVLFLEGELDKALPRAKSALALAKQEGSPEAEGSAHKLLASIHFRTGQVNEAIESAEDSLNIRESAGDVWGAASSQTTLGYFYHQIGQWALAEKMLRQAIYVQKEVGDYYNLAGSWINLGLLLLDKGQFDEALECMDEAIGILPDHEFPMSIVSGFYLNRGLVFLRSGNAEKAICDFEEGLEGAQTQSNNDLSALAFAYLAEGHLKMGISKEAKKLIEQSLGLVDSTTTNEFKADILRVKARIASSKNEFVDALRENLEARNLIGEIGNHYECARLMVDHAEIYLAQIEQEMHYDEGVVIQTENALETFQQLGAKADIARGEEILFKIISKLTEEQKLSKRIQKYPIVVLDINLLLPSLGPEHLEGVILSKKSIFNELKTLAKEENVFLNTSPTGFTLVLTNAYLTAVDRMAVRAIEYAQSAIMSCVLLNKTYRRKYGYEIGMKAGITIGSTSELVSNQEKATLFCSVSQPGRNANILAETAPEFQILITGELHSEIQDTYELHLFDNASDRRLPSLIYLIGETVSQSETAGTLPQSSSSLIGRKAELAAINNRIRRTKLENRGFVTYIEAEAGMGKTRLLKEVIRNSGDEYLYLNGKCEAFRSNISYWPLVEILDKFDLPGNQTYLRLKSFLGMHPPVEADEALLGNLPSDALRKEIFSCTRDLLFDQANNNPVILIFEDVHFIDLSSLELLDYLLSVIGQAPISLILVSRSEMPGPHRAFVKKVERVSQDDYLHIRFSELTKEQSLDLVRDLLKTDILPVGLLDLLVPFIGHPLSIEEAIRFLIERRWLRKIDNTWLLADFSSSTASHMPTTFRDLLLRRLNLLDDESLHVLQAAALLGEVFDRITLNHMISGSTLAHKLTELSEKGWLQKSDGVNPSQYHFNHTLTRESIYSTLVRSKKQLLHQRAGEAIEFLYPESQEENLENLAYHFENSGLQDKSLYYSIRAAEKCTRRFALEESRGYYRKAEAILDQRYQPQSRMMHRVILGQTDVFLSQGEPTKVVNSVQKVLSGSKELSRIMHAACLRRLGAAWRMQGDMIAALEKYEQALEIIDSAKGREMKLGGKTVVSDEEERIDIQIGLSRVYFDTQRTVDAKELARRALDSFNQDRYPGKAARLYNLLAGIYYREGDIDQALALSERGLAIYQANGFRDGASDTYSNLGILSVAKQDHGVAQDYFSLALELHEALGDIEGNAITRNNLGQLATTRGNIVEAINHLGFSIRFARLSELNRTLTQALTNLGYAFTMTGELDQALESFTEAENLCGTHRYGDLLGEMLWKKSECLIALDDIDAAIETAKYALDQAGELKRRDIEAQALRVYARSLRIRGDIEDARDIAKEAWQMVEMDHDPHKRAKFVIDYALVLTAKNQHAEAIDLIEKHVRSVSLVETEHILRELTDAFGELIDLNSGFGNR